MKYFTTEWWENSCENAQQVFASYREHLKAIESLLPRQLIELEQNHTLHDSEVKNIFCSFKDRSLVIELLGWDVNLQFPVKYKLAFSEVEYFNQIFPQQAYVESELGDLGYWELDVIGGKIQMNMLFVSHAEFLIAFQDFKFTHEKA